MENTTAPKLKNYRRRTLFIVLISMSIYFFKGLASMEADGTDSIDVFIQTISSLVVFLGLPFVVAKVIIFFKKDKSLFDKYLYRSTFILSTITLIGLLAG